MVRSYHVTIMVTIDLRPIEGGEWFWRCRRGVASLGEQHHSATAKQQCPSAAYEESKWPRRPPSTADLIRHLMDQHGLTRADMVPILGAPRRVSEALRGKKGP